MERPKEKKRDVNPTSWAHHHPHLITPQNTRWTSLPTRRKKGQKEKLGPPPPPLLQSGKYCGVDQLKKEERERERNDEKKRDMNPTS